MKKFLMIIMFMQVCLMFLLLPASAAETKKGKSVKKAIKKTKKPTEKVYKFDKMTVLQGDYLRVKMGQSFTLAIEKPDGKIASFLQYDAKTGDWKISPNGQQTFSVVNLLNSVITMSTDVATLKEQTLKLKEEVAKLKSEFWDKTMSDVDYQKETLTMMKEMNAIKNLLMQQQQKQQAPK